MFRAKFEKKAWSATTVYSIGYSADDPSGLHSSALVKNGEVRTDASWDGERHVSRSVQFETGAKETILDGLTGTTVEVRARDRHKNTRTKVAMERATVWGSLAKELVDEHDGNETAAAGSVGLLSGFTVGAGSTARALDSLVENPLGFLRSLQQLARLVNQLGLVEKFLDTLPQQLIEGFEEQQQQANPYDPDDPSERHEYESFRAGYYTGYVAFEVVAIIVGGQVKNAVKSTTTFSKVVDKLDQNGRLTQVQRYLDAAKGRTTGPIKRGSYKLCAQLGSEISG